ncbi:MAG: nucleotidyltransferase family protein [Prolixibacteraceae bacterium]|nr:nucleotidyltransferase family protein [Prolixibacteraceae bacterium]
MTNKELFYFAGKCLSLDDHPEFRDEIIQHISDDSVNWQEFVQLCSNHLVLPVIYLKFQSHNILTILPVGLPEFLSEIFHLNLNRNEKILEQLQKITFLLNKKEIYPILLKGAGNIIDGLYTNIGERMLGDIDFLVSEEDYLKAAKLLEDDGYFHDNPSYFDVKDMTHYPRLYKTGVLADVEIHRLPVKSKYTGKFNTNIIDQEKKSISKDYSCFVLSDKHKIINNFIHTQLSNKGHHYGIIPLRDLYDVYLLSKRTDISQTINDTEYKGKAIAYFLFASKALNFPDLFHHSKTLRFQLLLIRHDLALKSYAFYRTNKNLMYLMERISAYVSQSFKSIYSKGMRKSLAMRITNRQWYENHLKTYIKFFSRKK